MSRIRLMRPEDIEQVSAIEADIFSQPWSSQGFLEALDSENTLFLVAEEEEIEGYLGMYLAADEGEITNVAVRKESRRKHLGEKLLTQAVTAAGERGVRSYYLEVRKSNEAAIRLYEKFGFAIVGTRRRFYEKPKEDAYVMVYPPEISTIQKER